ncbi:hypothetical protein L208DRAFT_1375546 [Tricholoma matsutake]|nr:hypothetical protein L208DRAFT_1375546 [Tricholoma matsutake 945]
MAEWPNAASEMQFDCRPTTFEVWLRGKEVACIYLCQAWTGYHRFASTPEFHSGHKELRTRWTKLHMTIEEERLGLPEEDRGHEQSQEDQPMMGGRKTIPKMSIIGKSKLPRDKASMWDMRPGDLKRQDNVERPGQTSYGPTAQSTAPCIKSEGHDPPYHYLKTGSKTQLHIIVTQPECSKTRLHIIVTQASNMQVPE